jgi:hypothetical protein
MNFRPPIIAATVLVLLIGAGILSLFLFFPQKNQEISSPSSFFGLPLFGTIAAPPSASQNPSTVPIVSADTLEVGASTGTMLVKNFTKVPDILPSFEGNVYISYPADINNEVEYEINYFSSDRSFLIVLAKEPIGETRRRAVEDLKNRLAVSDKDLCALAAEVRTPPWINDFYAAVNLGFPGCPGAVKFDGDPTL